MAQTLLKVKNLEKFIKKHGDDPFISQTISKMLTYKIQKYEEEIGNLNRELKKFEETYKKESATFYNEFKEGKLGDDMDFIEWSSLYQMRNRLIEKKAELEGMKQMIESYLDTIIQELSTNPIISAFKIIRKVIGDRGHESMERKLAGIGADISRVK